MTAIEIGTAIVAAAAGSEASGAGRRTAEANSMEEVSLRGQIGFGRLPMKRHESSQAASPVLHPVTVPKLDPAIENCTCPDLGRFRFVVQNPDLRHICQTFATQQN